MKRIIILFCCVIINISCSENINEIILSNDTFPIGSELKEINFQKSISREYNDQGIVITLKEQWTPEHPWKQIRLTDNSLVTISLELVANDGKTFLPQLYGAGGGLDVRFGDSVPKSAKIEKLRISADKTLTVQKIVWYDYNAK